MKKFLKITALAVLLPAAINHLIFAGIRRRLSARESKEVFFKGRFGRVRYTVCGKGKPLLLLHGLGPGRSLLEWDSLIRLWAGDYRIYAVDLPGFGLSPARAQTYSAYMYAAVINEFIRKVIKKETAIIAEGHSAAFAAAACAVMPKHFSRLVLVSPEGLSRRIPHPVRDRIMDLIAACPLLGTTLYNLLHARPAVFAYLCRLTYGEPSDACAFFSRHYELAHAGGAHARHLLGAWLSGGLETDLQRILPQIKCPIQVVWGNQNRLNPVNRLDDIRGLNTDISVAVIKDTGSLPYLERPRAFAQACGTFLS